MTEDTPHVKVNCGKAYPICCVILACAKMNKLELPRSLKHRMIQKVKAKYQSGSSDNRDKE